MSIIKQLGNNHFTNSKGERSLPSIKSVTAGTPLIGQNIQRPAETIHRLHDTLLPFATPCNLPQGRLFSNHSGGEGRLWLITAGSLSVFRLHDDLSLGIFEGPLIAGLQELFTPFGRHYFRASRGATISFITLSQAYSILDEKGLWEDVARVLAYFIRMMVYRDEHLVSRSSYTAIRVKLLEYMVRRELLARNRIGIVAYIQSTTLLSRSLIYHVLSVLERGGYIKISRGKLEEITHLPENF
ncbi:helix-turn-helix domain-containing protein [Lelliottia sp. V106_10]|uniref:helix-turn-helix domain-containing protein n=1 Tax=Lelliottia wanjuensis TaxID=3050585 RepID=UPI002549D9B1|nr:MULTISPECIES: helix-turn-helix domain-containing protein [unclassified Lelliottia]MDK9358856.1 helix-turn-helix domain-containing protein [Lelliottia sp. V106_16]MDK9373543.1 helix-turn-helix domain-containing protein [Lelliottia sp. V106_10]MDK9600416.1 helix-turn-helix domain-containing protein [Lelliottia sp. V106_5]